MKVFHICDVLSITTGRLVSSRHMDGVYDILNFLTGESIFTHQIPRVMRECEPWMQAQFPQLSPGNPLMVGLLQGLEETLSHVEGDKAPAIARWVEAVRVAVGVPEHLPVYELGTDMHTHIDPIEEAKAMVGDERVIAVQLPDDADREER